MSMSLLNLLNPSTFKIASLCPCNSFLLSPSQTSHNPFSSQTLKIPSKRPNSFSPLETDYLLQNDDEVVDRVIGDCLVFEEGVFEDPYLQNDVASAVTKKKNASKSKGRSKKRNKDVELEPENLVPEKWRDVQEEMNLSKNQKRRIAQQLEFGRRVEKKKQGYMPLRSLNLKEYLAYKEKKLAQLKPLVLDNPTSFPDAGEFDDDDDDRESEENANTSSSSSERLAPKNPKWAVYGRGLDDVTEFFNSGIYQPPDKKSEGKRKLFTEEEKVLLKRRLPDLATATSKKWLPLHTLAASGEFYFVDTLLKHNVDINAMDKDGLTALHKAIIGKKQAVTNYLLRESANPFVRDEDGATLLHYAVQTASSPAIKMLLLYNVDINLQDNDGWTPLHLAVQARRTDIVKLLLIKGADKTLETQHGLTPLDLCLYSGQDTRTYELIRLLKQLPKSR